MDSANIAKRIDWIDCPKEIGIILIILGHTVVNYGNMYERMLRGRYFFFSHAVIFYIVLCYFQLIH